MNVKQMYACAGLSLLLVSSVTSSHAMDRKAQIGLGGLGAVVLISVVGWYCLKKSAGASTVNPNQPGKNPATQIMSTSPNTGSPRTVTPGSSQASPRN
jgi:hypothetical protein